MKWNGDVILIAAPLGIKILNQFSRAYELYSRGPLRRRIIFHRRMLIKYVCPSINKL